MCDNTYIFDDTIFFKFKAKLKKDKLPVPKITPKQAEAIAKFKKERDIEKKKQKKKGRQLAEGLGLAGALAGLGELTGAVTAIFGVINYIPQLFTGNSSIHLNSLLTSYSFELATYETAIKKT